MVKMDIKFIPAKYKSEFQIPSNLAEYLIQNLDSNSKNIAIFASVQFLPCLNQIKDILTQNNFTVLTSIPDRAQYKSQILGCNSYPDNLNLKLDIVDAYLYVGDGNFHPNAILLTQNENDVKPIFTLNPLNANLKILDNSWLMKYWKKKKGNLLKFYNSNTIGVFISSKWGQNYEKTALSLKEKYKEKDFYYFIGDNFSIEETDNFPFIDCWVNTACPRIGQDDILNHGIPLVNIKDILYNSN